MKFTKQFSLLFAVVWLFAITAAAQTSPGKLLLTKGQKIEIDNNIKSVINQEMMGQAMEITSDAHMIYLAEVKDKKPDSYLVSFTLTRLTTNGSAMGQEMKFDSDNKEDMESETGKALKDQLNVSKEAEFNESAKVINSVKKDTKVSGGGGPFMEMMKQFTDGNGDGSTGATAFEVIPAGKKVGDSWSDSVITESIKTYTNYTFKELDANNATITFTGKQVTKMKVEQQGMEINISMDGKISGEETVDMSTGLIKKKTTLLEGTSNTEVMGQTIPGTTKVTTTIIVKTL
ncbi:MAG: hypothetical protein H7Z13_19475 [Ferruginibacter sp.]|nr:hypothetical protein [Ferruginibacter sp.]